MSLGWTTTEGMKWGEKRRGGEYIELGTEKSKTLIHGERVDPIGGTGAGSLF